MSGSPMLTVRMTERTAMRFRYILPILITALDPLPDGDEKQDLIESLERAVEDIDRALPHDLRARIDERKIAESRMNAVDLQRAAGVRPQATPEHQGGGEGG